MPDNYLKQYGEEGKLFCKKERGRGGGGFAAEAHTWNFCTIPLILLWIWAHKNILRRRIKQKGVIWKISERMKKLTSKNEMGFVLLFIFFLHFFLGVLCLSSTVPFLQTHLKETNPQSLQSVCLFCSGCEVGATFSGPLPFISFNHMEFFWP